MWHELDSWGLDAEGRVAGTLAREYRHVATVADRPILRRLGR